MGIVARLIGAGFLIWVAESWLPSVAGGLSGQIAQAATVGRYTALVGAAYLAARGVVRLLDVAFWNWFIPRHYGAKAPNLIPDLVSVVVWLVAAGTLLARMSDQAATGIIAFSSVSVAVIGFALKSLIADLFAGIAISIERPFKIGDWLDLGSSGRGRVLEINWRSTHLEEQDKNTLVVPNSRLSEMVIRNTSRPTPWYIERLTVILDHHVTAHQVERLLLSAAAQVPEIARIDEPAKARLNSYTEKGIEWALQFPVPTLGDASAIRYHVWRNVLRNLHFAGINPPPQRYEMYDAVRAMEPPNRPLINREFLRRVDLFCNLTHDELDTLHAALVPRIYRVGQSVVRQGEEGASLFLVQEGLLDVMVTDSSGVDRQVAQLAAGSYFGEMSLLTGAPRSATVVSSFDCQVIEIERDALRPLMQARPEIVEHMSEELANRQVANAKRLADAQSDAPPVPEQRNLALQFVSRIRSLFALNDRVHAGQPAA